MKSVQSFINDVTSWAVEHPFTATLTASFLLIGSVPIVVSIFFIMVSVVVGLISWIACQMMLIGAILVCLSFFLSFALCCSGCATSLVMSAYYLIKLITIGWGTISPSKKPAKEEEDATYSSE